MAGNYQPGPIGLIDMGNIDEGTLCRASSSPPGIVGGEMLRTEDKPNVHGSPVGLLGSVGDYLRALGKPGAPPPVRDRVGLAARFFASSFPDKSFEDVVGYLKGIDFSHDVQVGKLNDLLPPNTELVQYQDPNRPAGNFFAKPGHGADDLGIASGNRRFKRYSVQKGFVNVLVAKTAPVSDIWTQGRTMNVYSPLVGRQSGQPLGRAGELVGGGGTQIVIPDPVDSYVKAL